MQRQEYDEAMSILKARTVDAEVQRKRFDNMRAAHNTITATLATLAEEKVRAQREVTRVRAELSSAEHGARLAANAANDRAAQVAALLAEVERLQGRPPPERAPLPFPDVAEGGVAGWADAAQVRLTALLRCVVSRPICGSPAVPGHSFAWSVVAESEAIWRQMGCAYPHTVGRAWSTTGWQSVPCAAVRIWNKCRSSLSRAACVLAQL